MIDPTDSPILRELKAPTSFGVRFQEPGTFTLVPDWSQYAFCLLSLGRSMSGGVGWMRGRKANDLRQKSTSSNPIYIYIYPTRFLWREASGYW